MVVVFQGKTVDTWVDAERLAHCDALAAIGDIGRTPSVQVPIVVVVLLGWQVLLDIIIEVVVVIVTNVIARLLFGNAAVQIFGALIFAFRLGV